MKLRALTDDELNALRTLARTTGKRWKVCLRECWENGALRIYLNGRDAALIQGLRNSHGPSWLARFKLPEAQ